jgi:hypothetical protein
MLLIPSSTNEELEAAERDHRDVEDRDDAHSVLLARNDRQQIDDHSQSSLGRYFLTIPYSLLTHCSSIGPFLDQLSPESAGFFA